MAQPVCMRSVIVAGSTSFLTHRVQKSQFGGYLYTVIMVSAGENCEGRRLITSCINYRPHDMGRRPTQLQFSFFVCPDCRKIMLAHLTCLLIYEVRVGE